MGIEADDLSELAEDTRKTIEFVGDSITEGVMIDESCRVYQEEYWNRPFQDDVCATYAWLTAERLNLRPYMMGYGAVGTTKSGCGAVPRAGEAYPFNFDRSPVSFPEPDYIVISHGTNDMQRFGGRLLRAVPRLLDVVRRCASAQQNHRVVRL